MQLVAAPKEKLQLVGIAALFRAVKYAEIYLDQLELDHGLLLHGSRHVHHRQIRQKEADILHKLDYQLDRPHPLTFLRHFSKLMGTITQVHNFANFFIEACYMSSESRGLLPSQLALGALERVSSSASSHPES